MVAYFLTDRALGASGHFMSSYSQIEMAAALTSWRHGGCVLPEINIDLKLCSLWKHPCSTDTADTADTAYMDEIAFDNCALLVQTIIDLQANITPRYLLLTLPCDRSG
jgi:hypothetical protein